MNDISVLEKILGKFLTREQIVALTEEIARGVNFLNNIIDGNEKTKAKKEFLLQTFRSIDEMIGKSSKLPASVKLLYDMAKTKTHSLLEPLLAKLVSENDFSDLDDIPDVNPASTTQKAGIREQHVNAGQPQNGEQGGGRRRRRRHGRNRNNQYQQSEPKPESKPVETFPETSQDNKTSQETAPAEYKPETKSEAKPKRRTPKTDSKKPAPEPESKPVETFPETSQQNEPAPKKRQPRRKPKQNVE